ncbi:MAG: hypothetical protein ACK40U_09425, partial [Fervidobacterium pennivorans]
MRKIALALILHQLKPHVADALDYLKVITKISSKANRLKQVARLNSMLHQLREDLIKLQTSINQKNEDSIFENIETAYRQYRITWKYMDSYRRIVHAGEVEGSYTRKADAIVDFVQDWLDEKVVNLKEAETVIKTFHDLRLSMDEIRNFGKFFGHKEDTEAVEFMKQHIQVALKSGEQV